MHNIYDKLDGKTTNGRIYESYCEDKAHDFESNPVANSEVTLWRCIDGRKISDKLFCVAFPCHPSKLGVEVPITGCLYRTFIPSG